MYLYILWILIVAVPLGYFYGCYNDHADDNTASRSGTCIRMQNSFFLQRTNVRYFIPVTMLFIAQKYLPNKF